MTCIRTFIVDDFELFRKIISSALSEQPGFQIVAEASNGVEAVRKAEEMQPDLVILDISLPELNGIEVAKRIRTLSPDSKILFFTGISHPEIARAALNTGANAYVLKTDGVIELMRAIRAVLNGRRYVSKGMVDPNWNIG